MSHLPPISILFYINIINIMSICLIILIRVNVIVSAFVCVPYLHLFFRFLTVNAIPDPHLFSTPCTT